MRTPVSAWVALGANLGDARATVREAVGQLGHLPHTRVLAVSSLYRSAPHEADGPDYINAVAQLQTQLTAPDLLQALQSLEVAAGRTRPYHHAPRTLDLDLIFYGEGSISSPALTVPHPRWATRAFVLRPLHELWPQRVPDHLLAAVQAQVIARISAELE